LIAIVGRATEVSSLLNQGIGPDVSCSCNLYDIRHLHDLELKQLVTSRVGLSPILGNPGSRITGSAGNIGGHSRIERSMSFEGVLSIPYLTSRLNLNTNSGFGNLSMQ
ncbi:transcription regulator NOT2/NOT3/NOT5-like protein, partial [Tanacetum coccineum]